MHDMQTVTLTQSMYAGPCVAADNCLINGGTVDYGPFGFIEQYDPGWGMWISSGNHFAFMNQPRYV
jgi:uncharacterized protein YdiU (UPF0061 family)